MKQSVKKSSSGHSLQSPALGSRHAALNILSSVLDRGRPLDEAVDAALGKVELEARDRAFARLLATTAIRRLGQIDNALDRLIDAKLPLRPEAMMNLMRLGAAQLMFLDTPPHAAVATAVDLAQAIGLGRGKGMANAVLRRLSRESEAIMGDQDVVRLNTPDWLRRRWIHAYGEERAGAMAAQHMAEPPLDLTLKPGEDSAAWAERLEATVLPSGTLRRPVGGRVENLSGFDEGKWWVQDAAAALPVRLFGDVSGLTIFDLCAAPGGKTAQLAAGGAAVTAIDRSASRLEIVKKNLERLQLTAAIVAADAQAWKPAGAALADAVLLDAPCTATGTTRRHPDIPLTKTPQDLAQLSRLQAALLDRAVALVRPGGTVVYCTCSLEPEEGEQQIARLLSDHPEVARRPVEASEIGGLHEAITKDGDVRTLPCHWGEQGGMDGFFAARLVRRI
ncbi:MAG TPA: transcription antitermination factor NusB [Alphaproteobacteria bacterium]|nr:transcription antitermination factor NusB [Alphaproteobacteria bacterium]